MASLSPDPLPLTPLPGTLLIVDPPTVSESAPAAGAFFTLNATVRNRGNGSSDSTTLRYYRLTGEIPPELGRLSNLRRL